MPFPALTSWATTIALLSVAALPAHAGRRPPPAHPRGPWARRRVSEPRTSHGGVPGLPETASPTARAAARRGTVPVRPFRRAPCARQRRPAAEAESREASMTLLQLQLRKDGWPPPNAAAVDRLTARPHVLRPDLRLPAPGQGQEHLQREDLRALDSSRTATPLSRADGDRDGVPNQVETTMATMQSCLEADRHPGRLQGASARQGHRVSRPQQGPTGSSTSTSPTWAGSRPLRLLHDRPGEPSMGTTQRLGCPRLLRPRRRLRARSVQQLQASTAAAAGHRCPRVLPRRAVLLRHRRGRRGSWRAPRPGSRTSSTTT